MRIAFFHRIVAAITVLTLISAGMSALSNDQSVLCVGVDGHTAREVSVNGVCTSDAIAWHQERSLKATRLIASPLQDSHCGPCTDTEILSSTQIPNSHKSRTNFLLIQSPVVSVCAQFIASVAQPAVRVPRSSSSLGSLNLARSVSLRI